MAKDLLDIGKALEAPIFFFLLVGLAALAVWLIRFVMLENSKRERSYIENMNKLADALCNTTELKSDLEECRREGAAAHGRVENMLGRILDRISNGKKAESNQF